MGKKQTEDEFLQKLYNKHGDRFVLIEGYTNSYTKARFKCTICGNEFWSEPRLVLYSGGCEVCAGKKVLQGYNDLATLRPDIASCWVECVDNGNLTPNDVTIGSHKKVVWTCPHCEELYITTVNSRITTDGCRKCGSKISASKRTQNVIKQNGSLADNFPHLCEEWIECVDDPNKIPSEVTCHSSTLVKWKCNTCQHIWSALISDRTNGHGCPKCARKEAKQNDISNRIKARGSFESVYPELASELLYFIDDDWLSPSEVTPKSHKNAMWQCKECGHVWSTSVLNRANGTQCPKCTFMKSKSNLQRKVEEYLDDIWLECLHEQECTLKCYNPKTGNLLLYDNEVIFDNNKRIIIEVNGEQHYKITGFHKMQSKNTDKTPDDMLEYQQWKDNYKKQYALDNGYHFIEIPYYTEENDEYKKIIDSKIEELYNALEMEECVNGTLEEK